MIHNCLETVSMDFLTNNHGAWTCPSCQRGWTHVCHEAGCRWVQDIVGAHYQSSSGTGLAG